MGMIVAVAIFTLLTISRAVSTISGTGSNVCNGTVDFCITYEDGNIRNVSVDAISGSATDKETTAPNADALQRFHFQKQESFAGENGIEIIDEGNRILLIPGGRTNSNVVYLFNFTTGEWKNIVVYCTPVGLAYRPERDQIVGFCKVNTTYYDGTITCVPYFRLLKANGEWVDASRPGSCSQALLTANITNPVILQGDPDDEANAVRLYFAERGTNRLHEVSLSVGESMSHEVDSTLKINRLVPVNNISSNGSVSFFGLRLECLVENSASLRQKWFSWQMDSTRQPETGFVDGYVETESVAFDSYKLNYLVTFNAINSRVVVKEDGGSKFSQPLLHPLDDPVQCQNLVGPNTYYLICLASDGYIPLLINVTDNNAVANQTVSVDESKRIIKMGILAEEDTFYLLNDQDELSIYLIATTVMCVGTYPVRRNNNFTITNPSNNVDCTIMENVEPSSGDPPNDRISDEPSSGWVAAIVVPITVVATAGIIVGIVIVWILWKKKGCKDNHHETKGSNGVQEGINRHNNSASTIPMIDATQVSPESTYTEQRNVEDPPTNSVDVHQETAGNGQPAAIAYVADTLRAQNENVSDERIYFEQNSANCILPRECAEDNNLLETEDNLFEREDPIGRSAND